MFISFHYLTAWGLKPIQAVTGLTHKHTETDNHSHWHSHLQAVCIVCVQLCGNTLPTYEVRSIEKWFSKLSVGELDRSKLNKTKDLVETITRSVHALQHIYVHGFRMRC